MSRPRRTALCLCLAAGTSSPSSGQVLIQELLYNGPAPVATGVYVHQLRAGGLRQEGRMPLLQ